MPESNFIALFFLLAQSTIMLSGACLIVGGVFPVVRRFAFRLFLLGLFLAVVASVGYPWLGPSLTLFE